MDDVDENLVHALEGSWRKVASTHNLQALTDEVVVNSRPGSWQSLLTGILLVAVAVGLVAVEGFALVVSKLLPPSNNAFVAWVQDDWYYCFLLPLMLPMTVIAVGLNWFSLKLFKHNS